MKNYSTNAFTPGVNTKQILVLHHTGTPPGTTQGNINTCLDPKRQASFHYLVNELGEQFSFNNEDCIMWHAGKSQWNGKTDLNKYSIGVEVIGPGFSDIQRNSVDNLLIDIIRRNNIKKENVVRHKDITTRKVDIDDSFWNIRFSSWEHYKNYLFSKIQIMGVYEEQFKRKYGAGTIFNDIDGGLEKCINSDGTINAKEFFYFVMIGLERVSQKIPQNGNTQSQAKI